ncbi:MAG TPA: hypothetical protein VHL11_16055 [Phototrophicaceae bacterium]|jgi:hypothetical protein|nr:hypothetical protein [Phototrophicaceae bacterium]
MINVETIDEKPKSSAIGFTLKDVEANRQGWITPHQLKSIEDSSVTSHPFRSFMTILEVGLFLSLYIAACSVSTQFPGFIPGLILGISVSLMFTGIVRRQTGIYPRKRHPDIYPQTILNAEGKILIQTKQGKYHVKIHGIDFKIYPETAAFFTNPGTYRVYYLSGTGRFLSAEYLGDGLFK